MDNTQNFTGLANDYTIGRPVYATAFIKHLYTKCGFTDQSVIADIGSGTGKFAKQLLDKGSFVYCVEPNDDMRNTAISELSGYKNFQARKGSATETTLQEREVDFITTAQAFHWFDVFGFRTECSRILKENGKVVLVWNMRDMTSPVNQECFEVYKKYCPKFKGFGGGIQKDDARIKEFFGCGYEYVEVENDLFYDRDTFISRSLSGSYSLKRGDENYSEYIGELEQIFDKYARAEILTMKNNTVAYIGAIKDDKK